MKCRDHKMKSLVSLYQFGLLSYEKNVCVEAHLMRCDECLEEVYRLSPVIEILNDMPERFLPALQPQKNMMRQFIAHLTEDVKCIKNFADSVLSYHKKILKIPTIRIVIPVAVLISIFIILSMPRTIKVSDLAIIQKAPYFSFKLRDALKPPPVEKIFDEAMRFYQADLYQDAIENLTVFVNRRPNSVAGHFYLGVSLLLMDGAEPAIDHLKIAANLAQAQNSNMIAEESYWYLGNAYLKQNNNKAAIDMMTKVIAMNGEFEAEAIALLAKIEARKAKK